MAKAPAPEFLLLRNYIENIVPDDATELERVTEHRNLVMAVTTAAVLGPTGQAYVEKGHYEAEAFLDLFASGGIEDVTP